MTTALTAPNVRFMTRFLIALTVPAALLVGAGAASASPWHHAPTSYEHFPVGRHVSPPSLPNTQLHFASPTSTRTWTAR